MIIDALLGLFWSFWIGFWQALAGLLPNAVPMDITGLNLILSFGKQLGFIIPWSHLFMALLTLIIINFSILLIKLAQFIGKLVRG